jgi:hypothetical protein
MAKKPVTAPAPFKLSSLLYSLKPSARSVPYFLRATAPRDLRLFMEALSLIA